MNRRNTFAANLGAMYGLASAPAGTPIIDLVFRASIWSGLSTVSDRDLARKIQAGGLRHALEGWPLNLTADFTMPKRQFRLHYPSARILFRELIALAPRYAGSNDTGRAQVGMGLKLREFASTMPTDLSAISARPPD